MSSSQKKRNKVDHWTFIKHINKPNQIKAIIKCFCHLIDQPIRKKKNVVPGFVIAMLKWVL